MRRPTTPSRRRRQTAGRPRRTTTSTDLRGGHRLRRLALVAGAALSVAALPAAAGPVGGDAARGRTLFTARNCNLCHKVEGRGGSLGPGLDQVGARLSADRIFRLLRDPRSVNPQSTMPNPNLSEDEARHLAVYLGGLR